MRVTMQVELLALFTFLLGALCARLVPHVAARVSDYRSRRRFVQFVQPKRFAKAPPTLSDAVTAGVGLSIHHVLKQQEDQCENKSLRRLSRCAHTRDQHGACRA
jgi:hypothetical protein